MCHHYPPVVWLDHTALCFSCFARWFPGWPDERVADWLIHQAEKAAAWAQGAETRAQKDKEALAVWLDGESKTGPLSLIQGTLKVSAAS